MKLLTPVAVRVVLISVLLLLAGCNTPPSAIKIRFVGDVLCTPQALERGHAVTTNLFTLGEIVYYIAYFTWDDVTKEAGQHKVFFKWYKDDKLVSTSGEEYFDFDKAPYSLNTYRAGYALGAGKFRVDIVIDGIVMASAAFEIAGSRR